MFATQHLFGFIVGKFWARVLFSKKSTWIWSESRSVFVPTKLLAVVFSLYVACLPSFAVVLESDIQKSVANTAKKSDTPYPAAPPTKKELRKIIALSKHGNWALLGGRWLVIDGTLKALTLPQALLYPSPITFFDGRSTLVYAQGEVTAPTGTLAVFDTNSGDHRNLASLSEQPHVPAPSPDKQHVAYVSAKGRLQVVDLPTQKVTEIAPAWKSTPSWSPDGKNIAFEKNSERDQGWGASEVAIIALGSEKVTVLDKGRFPSWSPKGDLIAYTDVDGKQLKVIDPQSGHRRVLKKNLASFVGLIEGPLVWSPDQTKLIFYRVHDDLSGKQHSKVYLLDIVSGDVKRLASDQIVLAWR
jgi:Tol biopolymer transport system component